jgi:RES domain-containing protein
MVRESRPQATTYEGMAFRYSDYDTPFWVRPNSTSGRWHVPADGATQYLSLSVEAAWAELIRAEELRTEDEVTLIRMPMWVADLHVAKIADYGDFDKAKAAGFSPEALIDDNYTFCQEEGQRLRGLGFKGVIAPSAALPGSTNLTLFGPRVAASWESPPILASSIPTHQIAVGSPPAGIVGRVRFRGERHETFGDWVKTRASTSDASDANRHE